MSIQRPTQANSAFCYWRDQAVLPETTLLHSLAAAQECIQALHLAQLSYTDETFPRVVLNVPQTHERIN
jgi:hypothetical protein